MSSILLTLVFPLLLPAALAAPFVQVDAGYLHTCARDGDGAITCWGQDEHKEASGAPSGSFVEVNAGLYRSCARDAAGAVTCWGQALWAAADPDLLLDIDDEPEQSVPTGLASVQVGDAVDCGLDRQGQLQCWGRPDPLLRGLPTGEAGFVELSLGFHHACLRRADGTLQCWGEGSKEDGGAPFQAVPPPWPVKQVAVGLGFHTCGLRQDGSISCWGGDGSGDRGTVYAGHLRAPPGSFQAVTAGHNHSCALRADGSATCWGQVGDPPEASWRFTQLSSGAFHACGITVEGGVRCWGDDQYSQVSATPGQ